MSAMTREQAIPYVSFVVDDAGSGRPLGDDPHAIVRPGNRSSRCEVSGRVAEINTEQPTYPSVLVGWQCGFEPLFVAVHSYLDVRLDADEAIEMATEYLEELGWFCDEQPRHPEYLIR